jgi:hypothetical protein
MQSKIICFKGEPPPFPNVHMFMDIVKKIRGQKNEEIEVEHVCFYFIKTGSIQWIPEYPFNLLFNEACDCGYRPKGYSPLPENDNLLFFRSKPKLKLVSPPPSPEPPLLIA